MFCSMHENQSINYLGCLKCEFNEGQKWLFKVQVSLYSFCKILKIFYYQMRNKSKNCPKV